MKSAEPWYPAQPSRKGLIRTAPALASWRLQFCVQRAHLPFSYCIWRSLSPGHLISKFASAFSKKTSPKGQEGGIWPGVTSSWAVILVSAFKNWCIFICRQEYEFSSPGWGLFEPHALLHMHFFPLLFFFPTWETRLRKLKKGIFPGLELLGFWGGFFGQGVSTEGCQEKLWRAAMSIANSEVCFVLHRLA